VSNRYDRNRARYFFSGLLAASPQFDSTGQTKLGVTRKSTAAFGVNLKTSRPSEMSVEISSNLGPKKSPERPNHPLD